MRAHSMSVLAGAVSLALIACNGDADTSELEAEIADLREQVNDLETAMADLAATIAELELALGQVASDVAVLEEQESRPSDVELAQRVTDLEAWTVNAMTLFAFAVDLEAVEGRVDEAETALDALAGRVAAVETLTEVMRVGEIGGAAALLIEGANVFVRNGEGATGTLNGTGNLVLGYDEIRFDGDGEAEVMDRSGSHNLVVGRGHDYASYGGLIAGQYNGLEAPYAVVAGGYRNRVTGESGSVSGGVNNLAEGEAGSVTGGSGNAAVGLASSVSGGLNRTSAANYAWRAGDLEPSQ